MQAPIPEPAAADVLLLQIDQDPVVSSRPTDHAFRRGADEIGGVSVEIDRWARMREALSAGLTEIDRCDIGSIGRSARSGAGSRA